MFIMGGSRWKMGSVCSCGFSDPMFPVSVIFISSSHRQENCFKTIDYLRIIPLESYNFLIQNVRTAFKGEIQF